mmetsp:Transcript_12792/g.31335  ORF Transcript_12792/g.31335 Transcript_12792/m.31335 type:complete len:205 (-) Transcript_12792:420-1034(-)
MLLDVFAPSRPIERQNPQNLSAAAKPSGPKPNEQLWSNSSGPDHHQAAEIQDLRYMQLMNCQRSTGFAFDRSADQRFTYVAHMPPHQPSNHHYHSPSTPHGWVASIPLAGIPIHGTPQPSQPTANGKPQPPPRKFHSAEEKAAYEKFLESRAVKPVGGSRSCVDVPALRTHSRRTWNGQLEEKVQRTDNAPLFHSTLLRAMAHS